MTDPRGLANKTALYVLLAALALAVLTNRWVAASGSRPAFNIVSFDGIYFGAQWVAFGLTLGGLFLEQLETRHRDDADAGPGAGQDRLGRQGDLDLRAGGEEGDLGVALGRRQFIGTAGATVLRLAVVAHLAPVHA